MAPGDPTHTEVAASAHVPRNSQIARAFEGFFSALEARSIPYADYFEASKGLPGALLRAFDFSFVGGAQPMDLGAPPKEGGALFTAPFITYGGMGSNHCARELLVGAAVSARSRLLVCAQHAHDVMPFDGYGGKTLVRALVELKRQMPAANLMVLKQVASSGLADMRRAAFAEAHLFYAGVPQRVNKLAHDKFAVIDGAAIISTGNFTATQFAWGKRQMECTLPNCTVADAERAVARAIDLFKPPSGSVRVVPVRSSRGPPKVKVVKDDIFSEVNGLILLNDPATADALARHFGALWIHPASSDVVVPF